ncbi:MAG: response regulator [Zetaproteobacteria bacterium]|nr:response regulator [Zetaproteobacteria bacterium]
MNSYHSTDTWHGKKVLVVDDSPLIRSLVSEQLRSLGLNVCAEAPDGLAALQAYEETIPDLVILDVIMPHMHGIECYKKLLKKHVGCKVLFHTCLANDLNNVPHFKDLAEEGLIMPKPLNSDTLKERLNQIFGELPPTPVKEDAPHHEEDVTG